MFKKKWCDLISHFILTSVNNDKQLLQQHKYKIIINLNNLYEMFINKH